MRFRLFVACVFAALMLVSSHTSAQNFCFESAIDYPAGGGCSSSVFATDLDGDGDADLAVANGVGHNVSVLRNNGDGTFAAAVNYTVGIGPESVFAADLDGDGDADLAVTIHFGNMVSVLKNNGDGTFLGAGNYGFWDCPRSVSAADLDGDGDADLAVTTGHGNKVSVLKNNGDGTFAEAVYYATGDMPVGVFAVDLDGDDDADLVVANIWSDYVSVLKNNGDGTFAAAVNYEAGQAPVAVFAADLDGDNDADLAVTNAWSDNVSVLKNNGDGTFSTAVKYAVGVHPGSVFAADLDGDGDPDLATANQDSDNTSVLKNNGDGTFAAAVNYAAGDSPYSVFAADLDRDGDTDLAVANYSSDNVSVLINCAVKPPPLPADVDILPGQCPNYLSLIEAREIDRPRGAGVVPGGRLLPVALLGSPTFDVRQVDVPSIGMLGLHPVALEYEDLAGTGVSIESDDCECGAAGGDGHTDLVLMFDLDSMLARLSPCSPGEMHVLELTGLTLKGRELVGRDCVNLTGKITGGGGGFPIVASPTRRTRMQRLSPNPFNASTGITYELGEAENVHLEIYDVLGRHVRTLVAEVQTAGEHEVVWDGTDDRGQSVSSGVYFCRLQTESSVDVRQMVLLK